MPLFRRPDGILVKDLSPERAIMPYLMRGRNESAIYYEAVYDVSKLRPWLRDAEINYDSNLRLLYMAGLALNVSREGAIYQEMLGYRKFPANLFAGSEDKLQVLRSVIQ